MALNALISKKKAVMSSFDQRVTVKSRFIEVVGAGAMDFGQVRLRYTESPLYGLHNACASTLHFDQLRPSIK